MNQKNALEKASFGLRLPSHSELKSPGGKSTRFPWLNQIHNAPFLGSLIDKISEAGTLTVDFDVPAAIKAGLDSGEYIRKGGVIVKAKGHQTVQWLKEGQVVRRIGPAVNVVTVFVNLWSEFVLSEKLGQIQDQLGRIEEYVKAAYSAHLLNAHDRLKAALKAQNEDTSNKLFHESRDSFGIFRNQTKVLLHEKTKRIHSELMEFDKAVIYNDEELTNIYRMLNEVSVMAHTISYCYEAEARIYERLADFSNAEGSRLEALNFQLDVAEYLDVFLNDDNRYTTASLIKQQGFLPRSIPKPLVMGPVFVKAKKANPLWKYKPNPKVPPDFLEPWYWPLKKSVDAIEGRVLGVTSQLQVDNPVTPGVVYLTGTKGLYAVDKNSGELIRLFETAAAATSKPVVAGRVVIFGCSNGPIYAVDTETWEHQWCLEMLEGQKWQDLLTGDDSTCLAISDKCLYALDSTTGAVNWRFETKGRLQATAAVFDGTAYFGTSEGKVYAVDLKTGSEKWSFEKKDWLCSHVTVSETK